MSIYLNHRKLSKQEKSASKLSRVFLYVRVSTEERAVRGLPVEAQTAALTQWAQAAGHQAAGICTGAGVSARKPAARRPELPRLLKYIRSGKGGLARLYQAGPLVPQYRGVLQTEDTQSKLAGHPGRLRRRNRVRRLKVIVNAAAEDRFSAVFFLPVRK